jgi:hypothetical protein
MPSFDPICMGEFLYTVSFANSLFNFGLNIFVTALQVCRRFRIFCSCGEGSFGNVFKAVDRKTNKQVALKRFKRFV